MVEVLGGFRQNQAGVQAGVPDPAEAQRDLFDQVEQRVALHAHGLVRIEFDALFRDGQDAKARASQSRDGHQIMGPYGVTFRGTERTDPLDRTFALSEFFQYKTALKTQTGLQETSSTCGRHPKLIQEHRKRTHRE